MKKKEILKLIGMNRIINRNENLLTMTRKRNISIDIERIFPDIRELKDEFKVLQDELKEALKETEECKNYIKTSDCNHEVRLSYDDRFGGFTVCAFCKEKIPGKGWGNWSLSSNRNKYCVNLYSKHQYEEELDDIPGYEIEQAYEIVENILKTKEDDEQVDLVQEFKKLNLPYCTINEEKKIIENYILIIGGSNKQFVNKDTYLCEKCLNIQLEFMKYFSALLNTKIELIDNSEVLESEKIKKYFPKENRNLEFISYSTITELEYLLRNQEKIPFKVIIDLSKLYNYKISGDNVLKEPINIQLNEIFPNSYIIRIMDLSKSNLEELTCFLKALGNHNSLYLHQDNKYYYLDNGEIKSDDLENTCEKIKRLLKNK